MLFACRNVCALKRILILGAAAVLCALAVPGVAAAHVGVTPKVAQAGQTLDLTFSVPNERDSTNTTKLEVIFAGPGKVASADAPSKSGWSSSVEGAAGDIKSVSWERGEIPPNASDTFVVTITAPSEGDRLEIQANQTYSDGEVVRWSERQEMGAAEPAHPAPFVMINGGSPATTTSTSVAPVTTTQAPADDAKKDDSRDLTVGKVFIVVGVLIFAVVLLRARALNKRNKSGDEG